VSDKFSAFTARTYTTQIEQGHTFQRSEPLEQVSENVEEVSKNDETLDFEPFTLSEEAFNELERCMTESKQPAETMIQAAQRLHERWGKKTAG
jgi:hypothetical protein